MLVYKIVETSIVTEETLERILNQWMQQGWDFDSIQFVIRDASKRPSMAFLFFVKEEVREEDHSLPDDRGAG
ncbi:MAG: DUF4177 domain-containing protein [Deltaproteobacteria bacterium RBG_13_52_11]|nr:MAG: DUF4177 domain-containing protein [Deltaproteobacteria bacterium RBG_13_52_11]